MTSPTYIVFSIMWLYSILLKKRRRTLFFLLVLTFVTILVFAIQLQQRSIQSGFRTEFQRRYSYSPTEPLNAHVTHFRHNETRFVVYLSLLHGQRLRVFLIDPTVLFPFIPSSSREWISRDAAIENLFYQYDNKDLSESPSIILAGILSNDTGSDNLTLSQVIEQISMVGRDADFQVQIAQDELPAQFHLDSEHENKGVLPTHIVFTKNRLTLHIIIFHPVVNTSFFWTSPFKKPAYGISLQPQYSFNIPLPDRSTIFDEFGIQTAELEFPNGRNGTASVEVLIPLNILHFVQQLPHSSYVECNRAFASEFRHKYSANFSEQNRTFADTNSRYTLQQLKHILKLSFIPFWACCGTLLGWWRECSAIPYTSDLDFCTFSSFSKEDGLVDEIINLMRSGKTFQHFWTYGLPREGLEMVFVTVTEPTTNASFRADLFFMYPASKEYIGKSDKLLSAKEGLENNHTKAMDERHETPNQGTTGGKEKDWVYYLHWTETSEYQFYHLPAVRDFCSTDLWGLKVMVPCDPIPTLENDYGQERWKLAISKGFSYGGNMSGRYKWDKTKQSKAFGSYRIRA